MKNVGVTPETYHSIDRSGLTRKYKRYEAFCNCSKGKVSHVVAGMIRNGTSIYTCNKCNHDVKLKE